ncbi:MAG: hypothetical protein LC658_07195, partial [Bacteroidales bacterium]|nr:hypothetical protein [Bacteroidales bacterium]
MNKIISGKSIKENETQARLGNLIFDEFEELVFDGHPIARNILGTSENINKFNRNSILKFIDNNYHTDQMV